MIQLPSLIQSTQAKFLFLCLIFTWSPTLFSQQKFDTKLLESPKSNGAFIANKLKAIEVQEYAKPDGNCVFLKNGFRQATFVNADEWTSIKDTVEVVKVDVVYSKYPLRNGVYHEIYPLLFNRIKATIAMDPELNNEKIEWNKIWQTHCDNNSQINSLFHGVVIWYKVDEKSDIVEVKDPKEDKETKVDRLNHQREEIKKQEEKFEEVNANVDYILKSPHLPDSVHENLKTKPLDQQILYLNEYFTIIDGEDGDKPLDQDLAHLQFLNKVNMFLRGFPTVEPVITKVLDRHPEWRNKIVINDWTGSMYGYGAQVIEWHIMNLDSSGISTVTLFNDGDQKATKTKKIGNTGGIYTKKTSDLEGLIDLFSYVMSKGGGGDSPENDIEAILEAIDHQPESSEIILIADNRACVRDIELANRINRPVRIILCGYDPDVGVNAHYVYLAELTGGGIYTINSDFEELDVTLGTDGTISSFDEERVKLIAPQCYSGDFAKISSQVFTMKQARWRKRRVRILDASNTELNKLPNVLFKMYNLQILNLSNNNLYEVSPKIQNLNHLSDLNLSNNHISHLPKSFKKIKHLEYLDLSNNDIDTVPEEIIPLRFIRKLDLSNNNIIEFDRLKSKHLTVLNLSNNNISELPSLKRYSQLYELNLSGNNFSSVPENLPLTKNLQLLDLSKNKLTHLPDDLTDFAELKSLNLSGNNFSYAEEDRIRKMLFYTDIQF